VSCLDILAAVLLKLWSPPRLPAQAVEMANQLEAGQIFTNLHGGRLDVQFGGFKHSGIGRVFGQGDIDAFTEMQTLQMKIPSPKL
jgi:acyl-CoA reductase-like NAD-dependent aldehyde dehydrogenase